ncbi:MAG: polysaccharide deacetylase [Clostridia bacterium]|nr:polysaccharide deacetylase [Clostridia bacterium]
MSYFHMRFPGGKTKAVTFSYDDGVAQDLRLAALTERYGIKCTFNINSAFVAETPGGGKLTYAQIKEQLLAKGHEAAIHGEYHLAPGSSRTLVGLRDALNCRLQLEQNLGVIIRGMAYPNSGVTRFTGGSDYETVRRYLQDIGVVYARSLGGDNNGFLLPEDWYRWIPTAHHDNPHVLDWAREFVDLRVDEAYIDNRYPRLFYLWGHSYEFDVHDNWDHIEELCGLLGGKEDVWYATNMEIWEYTNAFRSLVFSADGTRVYNPTLRELCFETETQPYQLRPGEIISL